TSLAALPQIALRSIESAVDRSSAQAAPSQWRIDAYPDQSIAIQIFDGLLPQIPRRGRLPNEFGTWTRVQRCPSQCAAPSPPAMIADGARRDPIEPTAQGSTVAPAELPG